MKDVPKPKKDESGNLVTAPTALKNLYSKTYEKRLSKREMKLEFKDLEMLKTKMWNVQEEILLQRPS